MIIVSWNMQWGRGVDGKVDLQRIVRTAQALGDFDVLCLQEVADHYPGLDGAGKANQFAELPELLPGFHAIEGVAVERNTPGIGRQRFGNMMFTREAPVQVLRHQLPWPGDGTQASMPRLVIEAVLPAPGGAIRVLTTHLEYYSALQRAAQVERLRQLQAEAGSHARLPPQAGQEGKPFETRERNSRGVICGDFNCDAPDPMIARLQQPEGQMPGWCDAWPVAHPGQPHPMTIGLHDHQQWPDGPQCFDFFLVSADLKGAVRRMEVDAATDASDHQPILLELEL
ncbi:endonuclease [Ramlibacter sp. G-1-2-2]|uniref:Endonuclease n=1 Tax=Ramlibacter agri TaxID=2728837 RepID=A0A848H166_9BURK|nr:endonuclease/exonuclease/phosphatase family protein [Ramlibacter agri]NML44726.1 endonuclease [Ramlibacter agri]